MLLDIPIQFLHNLLVYGPDILRQSPTQINTQFVYGPNMSLQSHQILM